MRAMQDWSIKNAEPKTPHFLSLNQDIVAWSQEEKCGLKYEMLNFLRANPGFRFYAYSSDLFSNRLILAINRSGWKGFVR